MRRLSVRDLRIANVLEKLKTGSNGWSYLDAQTALVPVRRECGPVVETVSRGNIEMIEQGPFSGLFNAFKAGQLSRRQFIARATALGMSASVAGFIVNSAKPTGALAHDSTPAVAASARPSAGTENITRGAGGEVKILLWQAVTSLSPHT